MPKLKRFSEWRPHPWHGLDVGPDPPKLVHAYIEICPFDLVKYELDKESGYIRVDRPQRTSSQPPTLYGFIPQTFCGENVRKLMSGTKVGDGDPLDVCVVSERPILRSDLIVTARVVGGLPMIDGGEADDKIIAVLENDPIWFKANDLTDLPSVLIDRLKHYFLTYKIIPGVHTDVSIGDPYNRDHAEKVVRAAMDDYLLEYHNV
ncbi:MAG: inorganic pyrophosphatase [Bacteroidota bacterium]|nr:inorganic pyrophosphatase [Bacteroidota bacterium]